MTDDLEPDAGVLAMQNTSPREVWPGRPIPSPRLRLSGPSMQPQVRRRSQVQPGSVSQPAAEAVLEKLVRGVIIIDGAARVLFANAAAQRILDRCDGLKLTADGRFVLAARDLQHEFSTHLARTGPTSRDAAMFKVERSGGARPYRIVVTTLTGSSLRQRSNGPGPMYVVFVHEAPVMRMIPRRILRELYGLTGAESDVAALLFKGSTVQDVAQQCGISVHTVRSHLKSIFTKCGVESQAALLQLLALGPRTL